MKVDHAPGVAADRAAPTGLLDKDSLDLLEASGNRFAGASLAAPAISALALAQQMELDESVTPAHTEFGSACLGWRTTALLQERYRRFWIHEHMFASAPDGSPGIIGRRAVSSMAERGTST